jgi:uncharacterized protein (DUF302 family)
MKSNARGRVSMARYLLQCGISRRRLYRVPGSEGEEIMRKSVCRFFIVLAICALLGPAAVAQELRPLVDYSTSGKFEDVRDDLKLAIEGRGLVIDYQSFVNRMLERTGKDVGSARKLYSDAQAFVFCSAVLSRKAMEADPANVALCPYSMVVYALDASPGKVHVAYRRTARPDGSPASRAALAEVDAMLDAIAREAAGIRR